MGDKLGLYRALAGAGPLTPGELAERTGTAERYVREWLNARRPAATSSTTRDRGRYTLPPEQAVALTDADSPAYLPGLLPDRARLGARLAAHHRGRAHRRRASAGTSTTHDVFEGCERFFRPGYNANLVAAWLPALDGVVEKLERGATRRRRRLRARRVDDPDGAGVPELDVRRLRLPRRARSRRRAPARARPASPTACASRRRAAADASGRRLRPRDDVRLPARHGRPGRRGAPRAPTARAGRHVDDRRADRRRPRRGQPQPGRPRLLRVLDAALHARVAVAGGRARARRPGRRGAHPRRRRRPAGFTRFRRAAETPFNLVFEARP